MSLVVVAGVVVVFAAGVAGIECWARHEGLLSHGLLCAGCEDTCPETYAQDIVLPLQPVNYSPDSENGLRTQCFTSQHGASDTSVVRRSSGYPSAHCIRQNPNTRTLL